jgi:hypothetical protein
MIKIYLTINKKYQKLFGKNLLPIEMQWISVCQDKEQAGEKFILK